jgi:hypothetical protein
MYSAKALYWAGAVAVAVAAGVIVAPRFAGVWSGARVAPSSFADRGAASPPRSPASTTAGPSQAAASATGEPKSAAPAAAPSVAAAGAPIEPAPERPGFDVVRVEPTGETVIAGHAPPDAAVELLDDGRVIAEIGADKSGLFVILPPPLPEGRHRLQLAARSGGAPAVVSEAVTVEVAAREPGAPRYASPAPATPAPAASSPQPTVAAATPAPKPVAARIQPPATPLAADGSVRVYIRTVEATAAGQLLVKGSAEANAVVRLYLNGAFVADASAGPDRQWSLTIEHGMAPGLYTIRADVIDRSNGAVLARAEVPFSYPQNPSATAGSLAAAAPLAQTASAAPSTPPTPAPTPSPAPVVAAGEASAPAVAPPAAPAPIAGQSAATSTSAPNPPSPKPSAAATPAPPASSAQAPSPSPSATPPTDVVVADVRTTTVVRGDNLWDLARRFYRDGTRFRQIYAANASQIRDPSLIYIGQIFVVPKAPPP